MTLKGILRKCMERLDMGKAKYGDDSYLERDTFEDIREEAYDIINYAVMLIDKVDRLEDRFNKIN